MLPLLLALQMYRQELKALPLDRIVDLSMYIQNKARVAGLQGMRRQLRSCAMPCASLCRRGVGGCSAQNAPDLLAPALTLSLSCSALTQLCPHLAPASGLRRHRSPSP